MIKKTFVFLFLLLLVIGCQEPAEKQDKDDDVKSSLSGYWKSSYGDGFEISGNDFYQYDDAAKTIGFAGNIVNNPDLTASSGYITIKITNIGTWQKTLNYYYVIHWKNFNGPGVKQSSAVKDYNDTNGDGIDDNPLNKGRPNQFGNNDDAAEYLYTIENGYFDYYGDYLKQ